MPESPVPASKPSRPHPPALPSTVPVYKTLAERMVQDFVRQQPTTHAPIHTVTDGSTTTAIAPEKPTP